MCRTEHLKSLLGNIVDQALMEVPQVAAAFIVVFDQKVGYTIAWKRSLPGVDLDGVEYKSLPSGLHAVKEDLVYFLHGAYAGVSAFAQGEADAQHRHATFVAIGALVPLSHGQLGRSWTHAAELQEIATTVATNRTADPRPLELFWNKHRLSDTGQRRASASPSARREGGGGDGPPGGAENKKRKRSMSEATAAGLDADAAWPKEHPALYVPTLLDTFGPLLFPLQRAALARQRILFLGTAPVQRQAKTVYVISTLSNISRALSDTLPPRAEPLRHARPLFSVGVPDLPRLSRDADPEGWLACSTDDILGEKKGIYDLVVVLPSFQSGSENQWPKLRTPDGNVLKATQRDLRKWKLLRRELRRLQRQSEGNSAEPPPPDDNDDNHDEQPLLSSDARRDEETTMALRRRDVGALVEPSTWSALAYRGFMWWASAGEAQAWENDEVQADEELLFDMPDLANVLSGPGDDAERDDEDRTRHYARAAATLLVAYFRRVNEQLFKVLAEVVEAADDETEEGIEEEPIEFALDDVREMGLDSWSAADRLFVRDMVKKWFDRDAVVIDGGVKVCGLRVC